MPSDYLTTIQAAERLRISRATLYRWRDNGLVTAYRVGPNRIRYKRDEIETLATPKPIKQSA